ncbi:hypothetical protein [Streptomyces mangrovisoli]|uniref:Proline rich protein membrane protein n=1 Tax=Streptomyces mangrovisoli TaxID=1428628 RepID=A0A1J4P5E4_9ACTN|nr:hypothetical protein [Streptomyces mangrovisoli]OIJ68709.1 hypothetical protein WN71_006700 [Streptomyces mangrovisoli]
MRTRVRGWRWRRNPLRRRSDVVETWTAVAVAVLLLVAAPAAGAAAGLWARHGAQAVAAAQRADRHQVSAEILHDQPDQLPTVAGGREHSYLALVRWTDPDTGTRTTTARVPAGSGKGDTVAVWLDGAGRSVTAPPGDAAVWQHTVTIGACVAAGMVALILLGHGLVRRFALRNRLTEWERDWARTGPEWTRRKA